MWREKIFCLQEYKRECGRIKNNELKTFQFHYNLSFLVFARRMNEVSIAKGSKKFHCLSNNGDNFFHLIFSYEFPEFFLILPPKNLKWRQTNASQCQTMRKQKMNNANLIAWLWFICEVNCLKIFLKAWRKKNIKEFVSKNKKKSTKTNWIPKLQHRILKHR